jgi:hypothetical protein
VAEKPLIGDTKLPTASRPGELQVGDAILASLERIAGRNDITKMCTIGQTLAFIGVSVRPTKS